MNHTCLPKEVHLLDWARRDMQGKKGDRADYVSRGLCNPLRVQIKKN